jgi:hypothetical protein
MLNFPSAFLDFQDIYVSVVFTHHSLDRALVLIDEAVQGQGEQRYFSAASREREGGPCALPCIAFLEAAVACVCVFVYIESIFYIIDMFNVLPLFNNWGVIIYTAGVNRISIVYRAMYTLLWYGVCV